MRRLLPIVVALVACKDEQLPPTGQVLLYVTTDAVLPPPPDADGPSGVFDRLSIEIFPPGETIPCVGCAREVGVDSRMVDEGRASMGWIPPAGLAGVRARVRLYRTRGASVVGPRKESTLEAVVELPAVAVDGIIEVTVDLLTDNLTQPQGTLDAPIQPVPGKPPRGHVGTWQADRRRPCAGANDGEVCVPGGAYWLGEPTVAQIGIDEKHGLERLVAVSPFITDAMEATVKEFRASGIADSIGPGRRQVDAICTYTDDPVNTEKKPVNCLSREQAIAFCAKKKMRLPREGEWEWMATALGRYDKYPWGADLPGCADAAFGRAEPPTNNPALPPSESACSPPSGAVDVGAALRDRVTIDGRTIFDLVGNVSEWLEDTYQDEWESCFAPPILLDPICKTPSVNKPRRSLRGSNFLEGAEYVGIKLRLSYDDTPDARPHSAGVRCVRDSD